MWFPFVNARCGPSVARHCYPRFASVAAGFVLRTNHLNVLAYPCRSPHPKTSMGDKMKAAMTASVTFGCVNVNRQKLKANATQMKNVITRVSFRYECSGAVDSPIKKALKTAITDRSLATRLSKSPQ